MSFFPKVGRPSIDGINSIFALAGLKYNADEGKWEIISSSDDTKSAKDSIDSSRVLSLNAPEDLNNDTNVSEKKSEENFTPEEISSKVTEAKALDKIPLPSPSLDAPSEIATKKAGKKNHRKKKKTEVITAPRNNVHWGNVEEHLFTRSVGLHSIPTTGVFPIGLGNHEETCYSTVDEQYARRMYLEHLASQVTTVTPLPNTKVSSKQRGRPSEGTKKHRKGSFDNTNDEPGTKGKGDRSESIDITAPSIPTLELKSLKESERLALFCRQITPSLGETLVQQLNAEIQEINNSRDIVGCSCKPLKWDKMNVAKLKSELCQRSELTKSAVDKLKKADLIQELRNLSKNCDLCVESNCECVQNEVQCSMSACGCSGHLPNEGESCKNPFGRDTFDAHRVEEYRKNILKTIQDAPQENTI